MAEASAHRRGRPGSRPASPPLAGADGRALVQAVPAVDPSDPALGATVDRLRGDAAGRPCAWAVPRPRTTTSRPRSARYTPLVIGVVLVLGFLLLLVALQAPLIAAVGVVTNLLATGAAFGVARLIFQEGHLSGLLGFESQGFLDAWGPVFFFAMIFAISMDYTVFLLSSAKEHWDRSHDAREAMVGGLAHSGRVIFAAAAVMVAVFFTFALSGPLPPKEMGIILGVAVLLDALLVRLLLMPVALRLAGPRRLVAAALARPRPSRGPLRPLKRTVGRRRRPATTPPEANGMMRGFVGAASRSVRREADGQLATSRGARLVGADRPSGRLPRRDQRRAIAHPHRPGRDTKPTGVRPAHVRPSAGVGGPGTDPGPRPLMVTTSPPVPSAAPGRERPRGTRS